MMKSMLSVLAAAAALAVGPAMAQDHGAHGAAHGSAGMLKASSPANGSSVKGAPKALTLSFTHPMTLQSVALTGPDGKTVSVPVKAKGPAAQAVVPLPKLTPGSWRAAYKAAGADGHAMTGLVRFAVR